MPLAYTEDEELRAEVRDLAAHGAGGVEVSPFVIAGAGHQDNSFLDMYGWGTPLWAHRMEVITEEAAKFGLKVDQNLGLQYPATVPSLNSFNQPEAEQQLIFGREYHQPGTTRSGALPAPTVRPPMVTLALCEPAAAGANTIKVRSVRVESGQAPTGQQTGVGGLAVGDRLTIGSGAATETVMINALGNRLDACGTVKVSALANSFAVGVPAIDTARTTRLTTLVAQCVEAGCATGKQSGVRLVQSSVVDVSSHVIGDALAYTFPNGNGNPWVLIDFLQTATGLLAQRGAQSGTQPNYVVDHLSSGGAQIQADYWDKHVLTSVLRAQLHQIGRGAVFEDSLELGNSQKWTWDFIKQFKDRRGYDPTRLLPALADIGDAGTSTPAFEFDGIGPKVRLDYRNTVSDLYIDKYEHTMQHWASGHGLNFRVQTYGIPIALARAASVAGVPETEQGENFEDKRAFRGGAQRGSRNIISTECCYLFNGNYRSTLAGPPSGAYTRGLLAGVYGEYAGGVNQLVWHGYPYRDAPRDTSPDNAIGRDGGTWPGYEPWDLRRNGQNTSEMFGPRQASWDDYTRTNDSLARTQLVLRQGRPLVDLAVYYDDIGQRSGNSAAHQFGPTSATPVAGYTSDYVAPEFLANLPNDYKAIVVQNYSTMNLRGARGLLALARSGRKVFIVGTTPTDTPGLDPNAAQLGHVVATLMAQTTVTRVAIESALPAALAAAGVRPSVTPSSPASSLALVRRRGNGVTYDFVHNRSGNDIEQTLKLSGTGMPLLLDTWTGKITPIARYVQQDGSVTVTVRIAAYDKAIIALAEAGSKLLPAASSVPHVVATSDCADRTVDVGGLAAPVQLNSWSLQAETWSPGALEYVTVKTHWPAFQVTADDSGKLPSWLEIKNPDLTQESGLGTYTTSFDLPGDWQAASGGAYLNLGEVTDSARVTVNGAEISVNQSDRRHIDVGTNLRPGNNTLMVRVATTLINAKRSKANDVNYTNRLAAQRTGLMGPVVLTPYRCLLILQ